ncbi:MAG: hypothetical protein WC552_08250, partial [Candidatus Omnitrophota bacterium]
IEYEKDGRGRDIYRVSMAKDLGGGFGAQAGVDQTGHVGLLGELDIFSWLFPKEKKDDEELKSVPAEYSGVVKEVFPCDLFSRAKKIIQENTLAGTNAEAAYKFLKVTFDSDGNLLTFSPAYLWSMVQLFESKEYAGAALFLNGLKPQGLKLDDYLLAKSIKDLTPQQRAAAGIIRRNSGYYINIKSGKENTIVAVPLGSGEARVILPEDFDQLSPSIRALAEKTRNPNGKLLILVESTILQMEKEKISLQYPLGRVIIPKSHVPVTDELIQGLVSGTAGTLTKQRLVGKYDAGLNPVYVWRVKFAKDSDPKGEYVLELTDAGWKKFEELTKDFYSLSLVDGRVIFASEKQIVEFREAGTHGLKYSVVMREGEEKYILSTPAKENDKDAFRDIQGEWRRGVGIPQYARERDEIFKTGTMSPRDGEVSFALHHEENLKVLHQELKKVNAKIADGKKAVTLFLEQQIVQKVQIEREIEETQARLDKARKALDSIAAAPSADDPSSAGIFSREGDATSVAHAYGRNPMTFGEELRDVEVSVAAGAGQDVVTPDEADDAKTKQKAALAQEIQGYERKLAELRQKLADVDAQIKAAEEKVAESLQEKIKQHKKELNKIILGRGVTYLPCRLGQDRRDGVIWEEHLEDIDLLARMGVNMIRTYYPITSRTFLARLTERGIRAIINIPNHDDRAGFSGRKVEIQNGSYKDYIKEFGKDPAIAMIEFGNEYNYHPEWFERNVENWYPILEKAARETKDILKSIDRKILVATAHGEMPTVDVIKKCPSVDVWGVNIYRWDGLNIQQGDGQTTDIFKQWKEILETKGIRQDLKLYVSEAGTDAYDGRVGKENQDMQASVNVKIWNDIVQAVQQMDEEAREKLGLWAVMFMSGWDRWWKSGNPFVHDVIGKKEAGVAYDNEANEEWWGFFDIDSQPRKVAREFQKLWTGSEWTPEDANLKALEERKAQIEKRIEEETARLNNEKASAAASQPASRPATQPAAESRPAGSSDSEKVVMRINMVDITNGRLAIEVKKDGIKTYVARSMEHLLSKPRLELRHRHNAKGQFPYYEDANNDGKYNYGEKLIWLTGDEAKRLPNGEKEESIVTGGKEYQPLKIYTLVGPDNSFVSVDFAGPEGKAGSDALAGVVKDYFTVPVVVTDVKGKEMKGTLYLTEAEVIGRIISGELRFEERTVIGKDKQPEKKMVLVTGEGNFVGWPKAYEESYAFKDTSELKKFFDTHFMIIRDVPKPGQNPARFVSEEELQSKEFRKGLVNDGVREMTKIDIKGVPHTWLTFTPLTEEYGIARLGEKVNGDQVEASGKQLLIDLKTGEKVEIIVSQKLSDRVWMNIETGKRVEQKDVPPASRTEEFYKKHQLQAYTVQLKNMRNGEVWQERREVIKNIGERIVRKIEGFVKDINGQETFVPTRSTAFQYNGFGPRMAPYVYTKISGTDEMISSSETISVSLSIRQPILEAMAKIQSIEDLKQLAEKVQQAIKDARAQEGFNSSFIKTVDMKEFIKKIQDQMGGKMDAANIMISAVQAAAEDARITTKVTDAINNLVHEEVKDGRGRVIEKYEGYRDGDRFIKTKVTVFYYEGILGMIDLANRSETYVLNQEGLRVEMIDSNDLIYAEKEGAFDLHKASVSDMLNAVHKVRYEGKRVIKHNGELFTQHYQEVKDPKGNVIENYFGYKDANKEFVPKRKIYTYYPLENNRPYDVGVKSMNISLNKKGIWNINSVASFLKAKDGMFIFLTKQGIFEAPDKLGPEWHADYQGLEHYEPKFLAVKNIMMEFRDGKGQMRMALSDYKGKVVELDKLILGVQSGSVSVDELAKKFTSISFNHYDKGFDTDRVWAELGYSESGVKYLFNGSFDKANYLDVKPVGLNNNRHIEQIGNNLYIVYDIQDSIERELKQIYLNMDGSVYRNILKGVGFGPREIALYFDDATLIPNIAMVTVNEIGKRLSPEEPYKILVLVYSSEEPEKIWIFEVEATPTIYQKWAEGHQDNIFANSSMVREYYNGLLSKIYWNKYRVQSQEKNGPINTNVKDRVFRNSFIGQLLRDSFVPVELNDKAFEKIQEIRSQINSDYQQGGGTSLKMASLALRIISLVGLLAFISWVLRRIVRIRQRKRAPTVVRQPTSYPHHKI